MSETDTHESQQTADVPAAKDADDPAPAQTSTVTRRRSGWLVPLLVLLAFFALLGSGYWYYLHPAILDYVEEYEDLRGDVLVAQSELRDTEATIADVTARLAQQQDALPDIEAALVATRNELAAMAARLREVESSRSGDWVVAEAQYLVRLANQKLLIGTDIAGAVELLGDADTLLFQLGYPEARRAREALANDMVRLEQVPELDYQGIYFRLSSLIALVNDLPFPPIQSLGVDENLSGAGLDQMGWRRWWQALVSRLQPFFIIRRDAEAGFMMTNEQLELQKLRIQILLHEAQLGLMSTEQEIYRESLDRAAQLVEENFGATADATTLVTQIRALAAREVRLDVPDITASLRAVQDLGDSLRANPPAAGN